MKFYNYKYIFFLVIILGIALILSGCLSMNSKLDCPLQPGVMCKNLDQVNNMVDSGIIGKDADDTCKECKPTSKAKLKNFDTPYNSGQQPTAALNAKTTTAALLKVWLAPYQDTDGNFHAETEIRVPISNTSIVAPS